jgi:hypothetical protein
VSKLFEEFTDTRKRNRWLEPGTLRTRTSQPDKSARFDFRDGESRVHVYFVYPRADRRRQSAEEGLDDVQVELRREHEVFDVDSLIDVVEAGVVDVEGRRADRPDAVGDGAEALAHEV